MDIATGKSQYVSHEQYGSTQHAPCSRQHETTTRNLPRATGYRRHEECNDNMMQHATITCSMHPTGNTQQATWIVHRAARSRERRAASCVGHETCSMHTLRERCNLQRQDPSRMQHAGMRACRSVACCVLPAACKTHATCNTHRRMQHAPCSMHHQASQSTRHSTCGLEKVSIKIP
jgi:hypothetical protein